MDHGLNYWLGRQDFEPGNGGIKIRPIRTKFQWAF